MVKDTEDDAKNNFDSICNSTMVGFVQDLSTQGTMANHKITCFFAEIDPKHQYQEPASSLALHQGQKIQASSFNEQDEPRTRGKAGNKFLKH